MDSLEVVTPSFNRAEPLRRMLGALARQTHQAFSVTVVDDCSTVPVEEVLRGLNDPFDLLILRTPRNSRPAAAQNLAVD